MENLSPNIFVHNIDATISFYNLLGFEKIASVPETGNYDWVMMANESVTIMFQTFDSLGNNLPQISRASGGSLLFYIKVKKITEFFNQLKGKVTVVAELNKTFYGATEFSILDNNGYVLTFAEDEN
ncbi:MAG: glyoxalase [Bacteroidetes bacterium]|nr:glyoxalase [Bacteroidota bacterium]MBS1541750.1 glyoxalase [Bacteroidota bacterium]